MGRSKNPYFYHPFENTSFGVQISGNSFWDFNENGTNIIDEISLYYQPVQNPVVGAFFFLIRLPLVILGIYFNLKVLNLIKRESGVANDVTKLTSIVQIILWPFWFLFTTSTDFLHPLNEILGSWYCKLGWFMIYFCWNITSLNSLIIALMRYCFIVHSDKFAQGDNKTQAKRFFLIISVLIPFIMVVWSGIEGSELDMMSFINKCNGKHYKTFLIETSTVDVMKRNFCAFDNYNTTGGFFGEVLAIFRRISCIGRTLVLILIALNLTEAIIYYATFSHINRLVSLPLILLLGVLNISKSNKN